MSKIPTAEELINKFIEDTQISSKIFPKFAVKKLIIEFAKLHVEQALASAARQAKTKKDVWIDGQQEFEYDIVDPDSILNAYPEENIK